MTTPQNHDAINLVKTLGLETVGNRYKITHAIGQSFGGTSFIGKDCLTGEKVFMKYLICYRGAADRAKFLMEHDAL